MSETFTANLRHPERDTSSNGPVPFRLCVVEKVEVSVRFYWLLTHPANAYYFDGDSH